MKPEKWATWVSGLLAGLAIASILALFGVSFWGLLSVTMLVFIGVLVVSNLPSKNAETGTGRTSLKPHLTDAIETGEKEEDVEDFYLEEMKEIVGPLLGPSATSEDVKSTIEYFQGIPTEALTIIAGYGGLLTRLGEERQSASLRPASMLPHPQEKIKRALTEALQVAKNEKMRSSLQTGLDALEDFIPDDEVPEDPKENLELWYKRRMEDEKFRKIAGKHFGERLKYTFETLKKTDIGEAWLFEFDLDSYRNRAKTSPEWAVGVDAYDAAERAGCSLTARVVNRTAALYHAEGMDEAAAESKLYAAIPRWESMISEKIEELKAAGVWPWSAP
jgi:hypothetical protein